jgi:hypothetical protein
MRRIIGRMAAEAVGQLGAAFGVVGGVGNEKRDAGWVR